MEKMNSKSKKKKKKEDKRRKMKIMIKARRKVEQEGGVERLEKNIEIKLGKDERL